MNIEMTMRNDNYTHFYHYVKYIRLDFSIQNNFYVLSESWLIFNRENNKSEYLKYIAAINIKSFVHVKYVVCYVK